MVDLMPFASPLRETNGPDLAFPGGMVGENGGATRAQREECIDGGIRHLPWLQGHRQQGPHRGHRRQRESFFGSEGWRCDSYCCPYCNTILGVQIDPVALKTDTINELFAALRR